MALPEPTVDRTSASGFTGCSRPVERAGIDAFICREFMLKLQLGARSYCRQPRIDADLARRFSFTLRSCCSKLAKRGCASFARARDQMIPARGDKCFNQLGGINNSWTVQTSVQYTKLQSQSTSTCAASVTERLLFTDRMQTSRDSVGWGQSRRGGRPSLALLSGKDSRPRASIRPFCFQIIDGLLE